MADRSHVALTQGPRRVTNLHHALELVVDGIDWDARHHVVVKPNLVDPKTPHAITHRDALATVLEVIRARYSGGLTIAEGCAGDNTLDIFATQGYPELARFYNAALVDINADDVVPATVFDRFSRPLTVHLSRSVVESDCRVSLCLPKTHDNVVVTLSIKNMIMGSLINLQETSSYTPTWRDRVPFLPARGNDKAAMHQGFPTINVNLARLAPLVWPHLSVIDGYVGMEGDGPCDGTAVDWQVALASTDALAADVLTAHLMGFPLREIGYLSYCAASRSGKGELERIEVLGGVPATSVARHFRPHRTYSRQVCWHHHRAGELLDLAMGAGVGAQPG